MERPSSGIVKHLAAQVYSGNINSRIIQEFTPLVKAAWNRYIKQEPFNTPAFPQQDTDTAEEAEVSISQDSVRIPVYAHYEGEVFTASFIVKHGYKKRNDKVISYDGKLHSVSGLAKKLKTRIHKKLNVTKAAETAGWTEFWYYKDAQRKEGPIDDFRKYPALVDQYLHNKGQ